MGKEKKPPFDAKLEKLAHEAGPPLAGIYDAENERVAKLAKGVEEHEYRPSWTGMRCGAMVMRDGGGGSCGLPYGHSLHIAPKEDRVTAQAPKPLAEIRERTFEYEVDAVPGTPMSTFVENAINALYQKAAGLKWSPADTTLTVEITGVPKAPSEGGPRRHVRVTVRAWAAVTL